MSLFGDTSTRPNTYIIDLQLNVCPQKGPQAWIWLVNWKSISMAVLSHKRMPFSPALFYTKMPAPHTPTTVGLSCSYLDSVLFCWIMLFMAFNCEKCWLISVCKTISMIKFRNSRKSVFCMLLNMLQSCSLINLEAKNKQNKKKLDATTTTMG